MNIEHCKSCQRISFKMEYLIKYLFANCIKQQNIPWLYVVYTTVPRYSEGEIHFNLMAIVSDRKMIYQRRIDEILKKTQVNRASHLK